MISIYTELDSLENIITLDQDFKEWNHLVKNGIELFVNIDSKSLDEKLNNPEDLITLALTAYGGMQIPQSSEKEISSLYQNITNALTNPFGLFILNLSENDCKTAREELGLAVFPSSNIPNDFHRLSIDEDFEKDEIVQCPKGLMRGWEKVLNPFVSKYSNASVIIDRNLFSNEERGQNVGIDNIVRYLNFSLPPKLKVSYNLTIVTDLNNNIIRKPYRDKLVNTLVDEINKLRSYKIDTELIFIHRSRGVYPHTHQRRILKNYHYAFSEYGFSIFSVVDNRKVRTDNTFKMYHSLEQLIDNNLMSGIKLVKKLIKRLEEIKMDAENKVSELGQNDHHYRVYLNKNEVDKINNRLLN